MTNNSGGELGGKLELGIPYKNIPIEPQGFLERAQSAPMDLILDISGNFGLIVSLDCLFVTLIDKPNTVVCIKPRNDQYRSGWGTIAAYKDGFVVEVEWSVESTKFEFESEYYYILPEKVIASGVQYHEIKLESLKVTEAWLLEQGSSFYSIEEDYVRVKARFSNAILASTNSEDRWIKLFNSYDNCGQMVIWEADFKWGERYPNYFLSDNTGSIIVELGDHRLGSGVFKFIDNIFLCWLDRGKIKIWDANTGNLVFDKSLRLAGSDWPPVIYYPSSNQLITLVSHDNNELIIAGPKKEFLDSHDDSYTFLLYHLNIESDEGTIVDCRPFGNNDEMTQGMIGISYSQARKKLVMLSEYTLWDDSLSLPFSVRYVLWSPEFSGAF